MEIYDSRYYVVNKMFLTYSGLWPYLSTKKKVIARISYLIGLIFVTLPQALGIFADFGKSRLDLFNHFVMMSYLIGVFAKLFTLIYWEKKFKQLFEYIANNWKIVTDQKERLALMEFSEEGRMITILYAVYIYSTSLAFMVLPPIPTILDKVRPLNETRTWMFVFNGYYFVEDKIKYYWFIYAWDLSLIFISTPVFLSFDTLYVVSIKHLLGLFAIVKYRLGEIRESERAEEYIVSKSRDPAYEWLKQTIRFHKDILEFADMVKDVYSIPLFLLMGNVILNMVMLLSMIYLNAGNWVEIFRYSMFYLGGIIHLFNLSWPGQRLIDYSTDLYTDAYQNEWYTTSAKSKRLLRFFILRCSSPCFITAGGMLTLNFTNFATIVKTCASYFIVLKSTAE